MVAFLTTMENVFVNIFGVLIYGLIWVLIELIGSVIIVRIAVFLASVNR